MFYPLSSVHKLIYETIHLEAISQRDPLSSTTDLWKQVKQEIEESRLHLFAQLSQASGSDSLKVIVYTCQAGYVGLIKRLGEYINQAKSDKKRNSRLSLIQRHYSDIRKLLNIHLNELYTQYFPFFDSEQYVPSFILTNKTYKIKVQIESIRNQLPPVCQDAPLCTLVCTALEQMFLSPQPYMTYKQFHHFRLFLADLNKWCFTIKPFAESMSLIDFLIRRNFNVPAFIEHIIAQLRGQITDDMTLPDQAEKWAYHVKEFNQIIPANSQPLYPHQPSAKESCIYAAEQELSFVKQKMSLLPPVLNANAPVYNAKKPAVTQMTVSQLGVFTRLLVDCKVIRYENQTELLKMIAGSLTTTKAAQISAESLRVRYYNPDRASIAITKEYLLQMLKHLNQY